ncbi:hypothetical protein GJ496_008480 [Pomphorhynchus laevis]|nr:hypothetical protein GJ496_008480 [Pomphorhynchus laevis]
MQEGNMRAAINMLQRVESEQPVLKLDDVVYGRTVKEMLTDLHPPPGTITEEALLIIFFSLIDWNSNKENDSGRKRPSNCKKYSKMNYNFKFIAFLLCLSFKLYQSQMRVCVPDGDSNHATLSTRQVFNRLHREVSNMILASWIYFGMSILNLILMILMAITHFVKRGRAASIVRSQKR